MPTNFYMFFVAALIPMIIGAIWYHPKVLGEVWMKSNGLSEEHLQKKGNMAVIFGLSYLLSSFIAFALASIVIHQTAFFSTMMPEVMDAGSEVQLQFESLMNQYGDRYRSFGHGALHGGFITFFFIMPIIAIVALFERRGAKYILVHVGYWFITLVLMGGLLCQVLRYT